MCLIAAIKQGIREKRRTAKYDALSEQLKTLRKKLDDSRNRRQGCVTGQFREFTEDMVAIKLANYEQDLLKARQAKQSGGRNIKIKKFTKELADQYLSLATPQLIDDFDLHADHNFKTGTIKYIRRSPSWRTAEANRLFEKLWGAFAATYSDKKHGCYFAQADKGTDINVSERPLPKYQSKSYKEDIFWAVTGGIKPLGKEVVLGMLDESEEELSDSSESDDSQGSEKD